MTIKKFEEILLNKYGTSILDTLKCSSRIERYCFLRQIYAYICWQNNMKIEDIANKLNRHRTYIYHLLKQYRNNLKGDNKFKDLHYSLLKNTIYYSNNNY